MRYRRMNITLPEDIAKLLDKEPNKSDFIADAVLARVKQLDYEAFRQVLRKGYQQAAKNRDDEKDAGAEW